MELIRGTQSSKQPLSGSVVTLGNFDGLHLGHHALIAELKRLAQQYHVSSVVISFEPQPKEFFVREQTVPRLMRWREKYLALMQEGIDYFYSLHFNSDIANFSAEDFVEKILVAQLNMRAVVVGYDFRFGKNRQGDFNLLSVLGKKFKFSVHQVPAVMVRNEPVSSTRVRAALQAGDLELVRELLGRNYTVCGKVIYGQQRGRDLGFPTANINMQRKVVPLSGVFVIRVKIQDQIYSGVANVGSRPTFNGVGMLLEAHLFNFNRSIYGCNMEVEFLHKLRSEKKFENFEALRAQILQDAQDAKDYFANDSRL